MDVVRLSLGEVGLNWLPRSLRSMADVRAARTKEKVGHSGRDDREERGGETHGRSPPLSPVADTLARKQGGTPAWSYYSFPLSAEKEKAHSSRRVGLLPRSTARNRCATRSRSYFDAGVLDGWLAAFASISSEKRLPLG